MLILKRGRAYLYKANLRARNRCYGVSNTAEIQACHSAYNRVTSTSGATGLSAVRPLDLVVNRLPHSTIASHAGRLVSNSLQ